MTPEFTIFIDGGCPLCRREAAWLRTLDRSRGRLRLVDISEPGFSSRELGVSLDTLMGTIHGVGSDGRLVSGVEAFRRAYSAVGLGWLLAPTRWPILKPIVDSAYRFFAGRRLRWTGRADCVTGSCPVGAHRGGKH